MEDAAADYGAICEMVVFLSYFKDLHDPRQRGKITYPLDEILLLCLLAVLAGAETMVDTALFGRKKLALSCPRFSWTPICPGDKRKDDAEHGKH